ncbi:transposase [Clostridia bacterium]|nr:transposase [Clostridia bacterium]
MTKDIQLIELYCTVCHHYNGTLAAEAQRLSNNFRPEFTDEECITTYLFGIAEGKFGVRETYNFIKEYWADWFPKMPSYQNYNRRTNLLAESFQTLYALLISEAGSETDILTHLIDSMPIIVANNKRSGSAKTASELCDKGNCASKGMYYYGVKLHVLGQSQHHLLPKVRMALVTSASENDITVAKEWLADVHNLDLFADKAYASEPWAKELDERGVTLFTPIKLKKGQDSLDSWDRLFSSAVSSVRQAIESFFSWIQAKTRIQSASRVRSSNGLIAFIFARLASLAFFNS